jgi:hypothetical protein
MIDRLGLDARTFKLPLRRKRAEDRPALELEDPGDTTLEQELIRLRRAAEGMCIRRSENASQQAMRALKINSFARET